MAAGLAAAQIPDSASLRLVDAMTSPTASIMDAGRLIHIVRHDSVVPQVFD